MKVVLLGASNPETARMIMAIKSFSANYEIHGFIDNDPDKKGKTFLGCQIFGGFDVVENLNKNCDDLFYVNLITGSTVTRYETTLELVKRGCRLTNFIHPSINLTMTKIGVGNYFQEAVILQANVSVGDNTSIHIGTLVGHETIIGNSVFIAHGCSISGCVNIGDGVFVGTNATILPRVKVGEWSIIGAGSVITKDVPPYSVVVGNPARKIKDNDISYRDGDIFTEAM